MMTRNIQSLTDRMTSAFGDSNTVDEINENGGESDGALKAEVKRLNDEIHSLRENIESLNQIVKESMNNGNNQSECVSNSEFGISASNG